MSGEMAKLGWKGNAYNHAVIGSFTVPVNAQMPIYHVHN